MPGSETEGPRPIGLLLSLRAVSIVLGKPDMVEKYENELKERGYEW